MPVLSDELRYRLLKVLEQNPNVSQRDLSAELGISLGKVNYCLRALVRKGLLKARNFRNSDNKLRYVYHLTPAGLEEKVRMTMLFLKLRVAEVEALRAEIDAIQDRLRDAGGEPPSTPGS